MEHAHELIQTWDDITQGRDSEILHVAGGVWGMGNFRCPLLCTTTPVPTKRPISETFGTGASVGSSNGDDEKRQRDFDRKECHLSRGSVGGWER